MENSFSSDEDDQFFSKLKLDEITAQELNKTTLTTANTSANNDAFDDDDDVLFVGNYVKDQADAKPAVSDEVKVGKSQATKSVVGKVIGDDWISFVGWFENHKAINTPWFQTIPITGLNISECRSIVTKCKDWIHLAQFGSILVSFLKEQIDSAILQENYSDDLRNVVELLFARYDREVAGSVQKSASASQVNDFSKIFEDMLQAYIAGKLNLGSSRIPELLVKIYPKSYEEILYQSVKAGNAELLLPICVKSSSNFLKIMQSLHSGDIFSKAGIEDDPDFEQYSNPGLKIATNLIELLKQDLGCSYLRIIPTILQPIFTFDSVVSKSTESLANNEPIINELYCILNDLFCECAISSDFKNEDFLRFILNILPFTSKALNDKKLMKSIAFKTHPYVWIHMKKCGRFG